MELAGDLSSFFSDHCSLFFHLLVNCVDVLNLFYEAIVYGFEGIIVQVVLLCCNQCHHLFDLLMLFRKNSLFQASRNTRHPNRFFITHSDYFFIAFS